MPRPALCGIGRQRFKIEDGLLHLLQQAIALKPDYHDAYMQRGMISVNKGSFEQGAFDYGKALELRPDNPYPYKGRGTPITT